MTDSQRNTGLLLQLTKALEEDPDETCRVYRMSGGAFSDLCGDAQFDFLARTGSSEIEVECKTSSGDTGRKVHRQEANRLADLLIPITEGLADVPGCHLLRITVPDRLGKSPKEISDLVGIVKTGIEKGELSHESGMVTYWKEAVTQWPEPQDDPDAARDCFERLFGDSRRSW